MSRHTRSFSLNIIPILLYLRLFVPLVQCEIISSDWNSRSDTDSAFRDTLNGKASLPTLANGKEELPLWTSLTDSSASASAKDLAESSAPAGYQLEHESYPSDSLHSLARSQNHVHQLRSGVLDPRWLQSLQLAKKLHEDQLGLLAASGTASIENPYEDFAQSSYPTSDDYVQSLGSHARTRLRPVKAGGYARYLFSNLKRARDGYMCHFKLCQVGVSGKRLSM